MQPMLVHGLALPVDVILVKVGYTTKRASGVLCEICLVFALWCPLRSDNDRPEGGLAHVCPPSLGGVEESANWLSEDSSPNRDVSCCGSLSVNPPFDGCVEYGLDGGGGQLGRVPVPVVVVVPGVGVGDGPS